MMKHFFAALLIFLIVTPGITQVNRLPQARQEIEPDRPKKDLRIPMRESFFDREKQESLEERQAQFEFDFQNLPLEAAVDPDLYTVGPGDRFIVTVWATLENSIPTSVTPEGNLIVPTIGTIDVQGLTLSEVKARVSKEASRNYRDAEISTELVQVRYIRVHVTGQVLNPGTYTVLAVHRVSDAIEMAGGLTSWAFERGIQVRHGNGEVDEVDLHLYKNLGHIDANIYLNSGDVVFVPAIDMNQATVRIEGALNDPGVYELKDQETLKDFLVRAGAMSRRAEFRNAYVERQSASNGKAEIIPVFRYLESQGNGHSDLVLQDGDVINVPARHEDVYVGGAVRYPGGYPYIPGFNVQDYAGLAGSNDNSGSPSRAQLFRQNGDKKERVDELLVQPGDIVYVPRRVQFGIREALAVITTVTNVLLTMKALELL